MTEFKLLGSLFLAAVLYILLGFLLGHGAASSSEAYRKVTADCVVAEGYRLNFKDIQSATYRGGVWKFTRYDGDSTLINSPCVVVQQH